MNPLSHRKLLTVARGGGGDQSGWVLSSLTQTLRDDHKRISVHQENQNEELNLYLPRLNGKARRFCLIDEGSFARVSGVPITQTLTVTRGNKQTNQQNHTSERLLLPRNNQKMTTLYSLIAQTAGVYFSVRTAGYLFPKSDILTIIMRSSENFTTLFQINQDVFFFFFFPFRCSETRSCYEALTASQVTVILLP